MLKTSPSNAQTGEHKNSLHSIIFVSTLLFIVCTDVPSGYQTKTIEKLTPSFYSSFKERGPYSSVQCSKTWLSIKNKQGHEQKQGHESKQIYMELGEHLTSVQSSYIQGRKTVWGRRGQRSYPLQISWITC